MATITVPAVVIILSLFLPDGSKEIALGVMEDGTQAGLVKCEQLRAIYEKDFAALREAEKNMAKEDIKPRAKLDFARCVKFDVPISGQQAMFKGVM